MLFGESLDIPGYSLGVPLTQLPMLSRDPLDIQEFLGHPGILPSCPSHTAVWRVLWTSWDPPFMFLSHNCPMLSRGSLGHPGIVPWCSLRHMPPCCPEDHLDILILPWCPLRQWDHFCMESFYPRRKITRVRHSFNTSLVSSIWLAQLDYMWFS